jgi:pimeloyl-ACP methyl ester carboxylesterase
MGNERFERREYSGADGLRIVADVGGDADWPTVILGHGGGQTRHSWSLTASALLDAGYRVVNYDTRGHGESGWSSQGRYGIDHRAEDLRALIADAIGPVALVGASLGGITALYTAATTAELNIRALVLVDIVPNPNPDGVANIQNFMRRHIDGFARFEDAVEAVANYNPNRPRPRNPEGLMKNLRERDGRIYWHWDPRMIADEQSPGQEELARALRAPAARPTLPVLLTRGLNSDVVSEEGVAQLRALLPQTEVLDVAGAGHMVTGDRNDAFNDGVLAFLRKHLPTALCSSLGDDE